jgi:Holliday junction resolvase
MNFICVRNEEDKNYMINKGFKFITKQKTKNETVYIFESDLRKISTFSKKDKGRFFFTNKLNF